jgi:asparagine synthase (glutamine-hydrolysing)
MSRNVKVAMTGTGGDELFGGYGKYRYLERGVAWRLWSLATGGRLTSGPWTPERLARFVGGSRTTCFHDAFYYFSDASKQAFFNGLPEGVDTARMLAQMLGDAAGAAGRRNAATLVDMRTQLPEEFLMMTDRFSMAHSVEARVPFLDHEFVELCLSIPPARRFRDEDYKYLLRQAIADLLPAELLTAPKKGFVLPIGAWLRGGLRGLVETLLGRERLRRQGIFKPSLYDEVVAPFLTGPGSQRPVQIWALLMFQLWHWVFVEQRFDVSPRLSANEIAS